MLKPEHFICPFSTQTQPPSGGCVLKLFGLSYYPRLASAAAFGRLCVETIFSVYMNLTEEAAAFGRLCVETYPAD